MEHSWIPSGLYDEHCVHKFPYVGSGWAGVHLNTTGQSRSTSPLVPDLWIAGCLLADGDVTDDREPWCWICVHATQNLSGWVWHSLIAECMEWQAYIYLSISVLSSIRKHYPEYMLDELLIPMQAACICLRPGWQPLSVKRDGYLLLILLERITCVLTFVKAVKQLTQNSKWWRF